MTVKPAPRRTRGFSRNKEAAFEGPAGAGPWVVATKAPFWEEALLRSCRLPFAGRENERKNARFTNIAPARPGQCRLGLHTGNLNTYPGVAANASEM